jgi:glutamine synthetase
MIIEYVWIDGKFQVRSKTRVLKIKHVQLSDIPQWNYDGSSTEQATTENSEVILRPVSLYPSPFMSVDYLVLCDTLLPSGEPHPTNTRVKYPFMLNKGERFGFEQEFFLTDQTGTILTSNKPQGDYYCGVGANNAIERKCILEAMTNCIRAGLNITGMNAEVAPAQWELQIDDMGISACDGLWMLRYILTRTVESYGFGINFHPKPLSPEWNGSGCHTNFSTTLMREPNGYEYILQTIYKLRDSHSTDIELYGKDNRLRLSGTCETSSYDKFSYGIADRTASIRIPSETYRNACGYLEDRRPASNMDPYTVATVLLATLE